MLSEWNLKFSFMERTHKYIGKQAYWFNPKVNYPPALLIVREQKYRFPVYDSICPSFCASHVQFLPDVYELISEFIAILGEVQKSFLINYF